MPRPQTSQRKLSQIASKPQNSRRFSPSKVSRYTALTSEHRYSWSKFTASGHLCGTCCKFSLALLRQLHSNPCFTIPALTWQMVSEVCTCMLTLLCITSSCHVRMHCQSQDMLTVTVSRDRLSHAASLTSETMSVTSLVPWHFLYGRGEKGEGRVWCINRP